MAKDFVDSVLEYYRGLNQDPRLPCSRDMSLEEILERERARTGVNYVRVGAEEGGKLGGKGLLRNENLRTHH